MTMVAVWTVASLSFHAVRLLQAWLVRWQGGVVEPWDQPRAAELDDSALRSPSRMTPSMSAQELQYAGPLHRRPGRTIYLYVAREAFRPALIGLIGLTTVVLTNGLLGLSDLVVNRGVDAGDVARMLLYEAIPTAARMFPFATLVGALVALGRLGADREILTLEALGVPAARLVWPVAAFASVMTVFALWFSVYATPWASARFDAALDEISRTKPWATMNGPVRSTSSAAGSSRRARSQPRATS